MSAYPLDPQIDHDFNARESVESFEDEFGALVEISNRAMAELPCQRDLVFDADSGSSLDLCRAALALSGIYGLERAGFLRETQRFCDAWTEAGHSAEMVDMAQYNHFDITGTLADPDATLVQHTLNAIASFG